MQYLLKIACQLLLLNTIAETNAKTYLRPELVDSQLKCDGLDSRVCLNGGVCADWSKLSGFYVNHEACVCANGFYGPNCEYSDEHSQFSQSASPRIRRRM